MSIDEIRLFCFPFAGKGSSIFHKWKSLTHHSIHVVPIQYPGRESKLKDRPFTEMSSMLKYVINEYRPLFHPPFVFYGHSMGALVAYEVSRELRRQNLPLPDHLFVSGRQAPHICERDQLLHLLPDREFQLEIQKKQGTPDEVFTHPELLQIVLPILRADFTLCETYLYQEEDPCPYPITAFGGLEDPFVSPHDLQEWKQHTANYFFSKFYPGDHFFIIPHELEIVKEIELRIFSVQSRTTKD